MQSSSKHYLPADTKTGQPVSESPLRKYLNLTEEQKSAISKEINSKFIDAVKREESNKRSLEEKHKFKETGSANKRFKARVADDRPSSYKIKKDFNAELSTTIKISEDCSIPILNLTDEKGCERPRCYLDLPHLFTVTGGTPSNTSKFLAENTADSERVFSIKKRKGKELKLIPKDEAVKLKWDKTTHLGATSNQITNCVLLTIDNLKRLQLINKKAREVCLKLEEILLQKKLISPVKKKKPKSTSAILAHFTNVSVHQHEAKITVAGSEVNSKKATAKRAPTPAIDATCSEPVVEKASFAAVVDEADSAPGFEIADFAPVVSVAVSAEPAGLLDDASPILVSRTYTSQPLESYSLFAPCKSNGRYPSSPMPVSEDDYRFGPFIPPLAI